MAIITSKFYEIFVNQKETFVLEKKYKLKFYMFILKFILFKVNEAANLSPGEFTMAVASVRDKKMEKRKAKKKTKEYKIDRIRKKRNKNKKERKHLVREGKTYESQMELNAHEDPEQSTEIPLPLTIDGTETKVFFI